MGTSCGKSNRATPAGCGGVSAAEDGVDWVQLRADVMAVMDSDSYDDGSYAPILPVRCAPETPTPTFLACALMCIPGY